MTIARELIDRRLSEQQGMEDPAVKTVINTFKKLYDQGKLTKAQYDKAVKDFLSTYKKLDAKDKKKDK